MLKHALFLSGSKWPCRTGNGVSVLANGLVSVLENLNYRVTVVPIRVQYADANEELRHKQENIESGKSIFEHANAKYIEKRSMLSAPRRVMFPREYDYFPRDSNAEIALQSIVDRQGVSLVIASGWESLQYACCLKGVVRVASLVDPIDTHLTLRAKADQRKTLLYRILARITNFSKRKWQTFADSYLNRFDLIIEHAAHHAEEMRKRVNVKVVYIPHPMHDYGASDVATHIDSSTEPLKIIVPGSFKGASSILGFNFIIDELLPRLRHRTNPDFQIHFIGYGNMPNDIKRILLNTPHVVIRGYVDDIVQEFKTASLVLVAVPVSQGFRTRIAEAFGFGQCVVAHEANSDGMPELENDKNILMGNDGYTMAEQLSKALCNRELRLRIGTEARSTFLSRYSVKSATVTLKKALDKN